MLEICLVFGESEPQYAYKRYAYKKKHVDTYWNFHYIDLSQIHAMNKQCLV